MLNKILKFAIQTTLLLAFLYAILWLAEALGELACALIPY